MVCRFAGALGIAPLFFAVTVAVAQVPGTAGAVLQSHVESELSFAKQQLAGLHAAYDDLERKAAQAVQDGQDAVARWQNYYKACRPADKWICDE